MCGFAGFLAPAGFSSQAGVDIGQQMGRAILHRGPDDGGLWHDHEAGVLLSHRRLAILDLSAAGHQPMASASGRYVIAFNGEIYNHLTIRRKLETAGQAVEWRGHSDTETLLAAIDAWGLEKTLQEAVGMFAVALWDRSARKLTLARDRIGEKPLYYGWQGSGSQRVFLFGSELKALKAHPQFTADIDRGALALQMRHNYIPAPYSIYRGISKLRPGHLLELDGRGEQALDSRPYWSLDEAVLRGRAAPFAGSDADAVAALDKVLHEAIGQQMLADVPLGAFLSGGIDSSTVAGIMQAISPRPVKTFTIGFSEEGMNEAVFAKDVAQHLGTEHTELYVTPAMAMDVIPRLAHLYDEPFSDSSQIPTFLVSQLARSHVTVSLSGDAGDELFGGYTRYNLASRLWNSLERIPGPLRSLAGGGIRALPVGGWNAVGKPLLAMAGKNLGNVGDRAHKFAGLLAERDRMQVYRRMVSHWDEPARLVLGASEPSNYFSARGAGAADADYYDEMMLADMHTYLPDDILVKVDRAAMGVSLETRVPFLDHRVVEFAASVPLHMKVRDGQGKWLLRQVLYKYVPKEMIERPKMGFGVPIDAWLRGPLREWAESLLDERRLQNEGYFDARAVRAKWQEHLSGARNWQYHLWDILMFQSWLDRWQHGA
ncbi:asparagine synthase (glutamine-hydrolyzing) [Massilia sp. NEAU-DD11]|uniref:asparagine synthase (glutamine-hydrolyzing) n=1 Tax=Massilia cellulosiltytica TaxID=2683234 RepID=A0A7X3G5G5_9BURK|nr:asparagine synthase (glutamine-hydrolyzing) [Telluria cellulosilytica]MVW63042.1 asparagine synthase (glutamine-hydrolyzing) [Telluria cellulosilytica]